MAQVLNNDDFGVGNMILHLVLTAHSVHHGAVIRRVTWSKDLSAMLLCGILSRRVGPEVTLCEDISETAVILAIPSEIREFPASVWLGPHASVATVTAWFDHSSSSRPSVFCEGIHKHGLKVYTETRELGVA